MRFKLPSPSSYGMTELADVLVKLCESGCDVTVVGSASNKAIKSRSHSSATYSVIEDASVFWEFLKGRNLPGVMALDRASFLLLNPNCCSCSLFYFGNY